MTEALENDQLLVQVSPDGAELTSVRSREHDLEYIWRADPEVWGRHAPVLFPIVGMLNQNRLKTAGREYTLSQHGFARDSRFELVSKDEQNLLFELNHSKATRKKYPFAFRLQIGYRLLGSRLSVSYRVFNPADSDLVFSIGAHPGFSCPLEPGLGVSDHLLRFEKPESAERLVLQDGLLSGSRKACLNGDELSITTDLFRDGALVFDALESARIGYASRTGRRSVTVEFEGFPYLGIWSKPEVPFVCIEPWYGVADRVGADWEFKDKPGVIRLSAGQEFNCQHHLRFE